MVFLLLFSKRRTAETRIRSGGLQAAIFWICNRGLCTAFESAGLKAGATQILQLKSLRISLNS
jgi:hypothetical protein